jgi:DNA-binding CsgD family transcriptional regulator
MAGKKKGELTEAQKQCLRLVEKLYTSKEIARELGISHFTVDQRLDGARRKLNADTRKNAVLIFSALEAENISEPLVYEAPNIVRTIDNGEVEPSNIYEKGNSNYTVDVRALPNTSHRLAGTWMSLPPIGGSTHNLTRIDVFGAIIKTAVFATVSVSAAIMVIVGVMRILV